MQAAMRVAVTRDLAPLLVDHGVAVARRHKRAGQARRHDRRARGNRHATQEILCLHIQASMARRSALLAGNEQNQWELVCHERVRGRTAALRRLVRGMLASLLPTPSATHWIWVVR